MNALDAWVTATRTRRGEVVGIRPLRADDRQREIDYLQTLSDRSRYFRLHMTRNFLPQQLIDQLMDIDYRKRMAFAATTYRDGVERLIGVARYGATDEQGAADFAVSVADAWHRSGVASALMRQLMRYAHEQGFVRMVGEILPANHAMVGLARRLAFTVRYDPAQHLFVGVRVLNAAQVEA